MPVVDPFTARTGHAQLFHQLCKELGTLLAPAAELIEPLARLA